MSLRVRILGSFILVALVGIAMGIVGMVSFHKISSLNSDLSIISDTCNDTASVLTAHFKWRHSLTEAAMIGGAFTGSLDPETCALGTWMKSDAIKKVTDPQLLVLLEQVKAPHTQIHNAAKNVVSDIGHGDLDVAQDYLERELLPMTQTVIDLLEKMNVRANELYAIAAEEIETTADFYSGLMTVMMVAVVLVSMAMAMFITNWIAGKVYWYENLLDAVPFPISVTDRNRNWTFVNKPVEAMLNIKRKDILGKPCSNWGAGICNTDNCGITCLERGKPQTTFEQGDMDFKVDTSYIQDKRNRTIGHIEIVQDISEMVKTQKKETDLVMKIAGVSNAFLTSSKQIADGAQTLAQGSTEQAATVEQLSSSVHEIADKTKTNAEMAGRAAALGNTIMKNAEKGSSQMNEMMAAVKEINAASQQISKVIKVIDDIAFQTNILALNAAVEAARAGQHGKGFAVVAEEVRSLASKSAEAAKETGNLIANSTEKAELGSRIAEETSASLTEIVQGINESSQLVSQIAQSSDDQSAGIAQINKGIDQVAQVVQQNSATAEESAAASEEMSGQAEVLGDLISEFNGTDSGPALRNAAAARRGLPESAGAGDYGKY
ncbi:MAG: methyl-accepting chemotaxis protein [Oscillospiraceae bacterium]|jgi:methyl-accepting chemotaxis protein|nr:methyl-accepting chemotaxis protein [Oscillospiraceae bacterium]